MLPNITHMQLVIGSLYKDLVQLLKLGSTIFGEIIFHKAACFELYNYIFEMIIGNYFSST